MTLLEKLSMTRDINDIPFDPALENALVKMGLKNPAKDSDASHDSGTGETSMSNITPKAPKVDVAEPDNDGDEDFPEKSDKKTWEYGYPRGEGYHSYPTSTGYSYSGALKQALSIDESSPMDIMMAIHKDIILEKNEKIASFIVVTKAGQKYNAHTYEEAVKLKAQYGGKIQRGL